MAASPPPRATTSVVGSLKLDVPPRAAVGDIVRGWLTLTAAADFDASGPLAVDLVGITHLSWVVAPTDPLFGAVGSPDGRVDREQEFVRQRIDISPPQAFTAGEHVYKVEFPLPAEMTPSFSQSDPFTGELVETRYVLEASLLDDDYTVHPSSSKLAVTVPSVPFAVLSPVQAAQTSSKVSLKIHARRDHFAAGEIATVFVDAANANPASRVRILAVELLQRLNLWTYSPVTPGLPLSLSATRVVSRVDLPQLGPGGESHSSTLKLPLAPTLPPSVSVQGLDVSYEATIVAILGGSDQGGGQELRTGSEVFVVGAGTHVEVPADSGVDGFDGAWDDVNEDLLVTQRAVDAAVAQIKKMALESEAEYQERVRAAQDAAQAAIAEAALAVRAKEEETAARLRAQQDEADRLVQQKEQEAAELLRHEKEEAERLVREKEEAAERRLREQEEGSARLLREHEEEARRLLEESQLEAERKVKEAQEAALEKARILKLTEEETSKRVKAAEEAAAAAAAAAAAVRKANLEAMTRKPPLPARTGLEGRLLSSTGLVPKAASLQLDMTYKDSVLYQLFKLYYYDLTAEEDARLREQNAVPCVMVHSNVGANLRISKEEVPTWVKWQFKEESRSRLGPDQLEYAARLSMGAGRYYVAVFGNANPLTTTIYTVAVRRQPLRLRPEDFAALWTPVRLRDFPRGLPRDAAHAGHDIDAHELLAVRVRLPDGSCHLGYTSAAMKAPVIPYAGGAAGGGAWRPFQVNVDFEVLVRTPGVRFVEQLQAGVPPNAVPCGWEADGRPLYCVRATVQGKSINILRSALLPGEAGLHRPGATVVARGGLGILVAPYEVMRNVVPFEVSKSGSAAHAGPRKGGAGKANWGSLRDEVADAQEEILHDRDQPPQQEGAAAAAGAAADGACNRRPSASGSAAPAGPSVTVAPRS
ncbi:hypothetical protein HK405_004013 [Cladochytrium tenue]|nr:hypothetical protein HK405_004013 [Cladochytrium tenue]